MDNDYKVTPWGYIHGLHRSKDSLTGANKYTQTLNSSFNSLSNLH